MPIPRTTETCQIVGRVESEPDAAAAGAVEGRSRSRRHEYVEVRLPKVDARRGPAIENRRLADGAAKTAASKALGLMDR